MKSDHDAPLTKSLSLQITLAGSAAALAVDALIYPLDTIKTRLQAGSERRQLFSNVYRGVGPVIVATIPSSAVFFLTYESLNRLLTNAAILPLPLVHFSASATAELASCAVLTPIEVVKSRWQVSAHTPSSSFLQSIRGLSIKPLLQGYVTLAGRNLPFTGIQFPIFERLKSEGYPPWLAGGSAGGIAAWITTPIDVLKTRTMIRTEEEAISLKKTAVNIWTKEGPRAFMKGALMRFCWAGVGSALYLGTYESAKRWLQKRSENQSSPR